MSSPKEPDSVWNTGKSLTEKLKEIDFSSGSNDFVCPPVFPRMRVRVIDTPNLQPVIDDNHPTLKLIEKLHDLQMARLERDRLRDIELRKRRKAEGVDDEDEIESQSLADDINDSISETYSEPDIPHIEGEQSEESD